MIRNTIQINKKNIIVQSDLGFTIIELVIAIMVISFALLSLIKVFSDISVISVSPEYRNSQLMLAQELMEEIKGKRFDELTSTVNNNWGTSLGVNTGETSGTKTTYDDVDDFNGFSETMVSPYAGFTRSVVVTYVNGSALTTDLAIPSPVSAGWTPNFKRVKVTVTHSGVSNLMIETVVSSIQT